MQAYQIYDGNVNWFVRGTQDPEEALRCLLSEFPDEVEDDAPEAEEFDLEPHPGPDTEAGKFHFNPCPPSCGEHGWHLSQPRQNYRKGWFDGVLLDIAWEEVELPGLSRTLPMPILGDLLRLPESRGENRRMILYDKVVSTIYVPQIRYWIENDHWSEWSDTRPSRTFDSPEEAQEYLAEILFLNNADTRIVQRTDRVVTLL